ncbi:MAG: sensor histidine kinase [Alphaproteobacteria bacterium]
MSNAVKFTPKGGRVGLDVKRAIDGALYIAVNDTGIGMSPKEVETARIAFAQVFSDPFTKKYQGAGLGLSLASGLVQRHGGELMIKSAPGRGTTVTVKLPAEIIIH